MRYRRHLDGRHDIHWPAFVDIFIVLMAVSLLAIPAPPVSRQGDSRRTPPKPPTPMTPEQFRDKRLSCRLGLAEGELKPMLPDSSAAGGSIALKIPDLSLTGGAELPEKAKRLADDVRRAVFDSNLRSRWTSDPAISVKITGIAVQFVSGPDDYGAIEPYARQLYNYLKTRLANVSHPVAVTWLGTVRAATSRPQVSIVILTALTDQARDQAETDRQQGNKPCPSSPK
jgi:hypothetical protein